MIVEAQTKHGWGRSAVEQLSVDLKKAFGGTIGFSRQNLWYMRPFYLEYKDHPNLQQLVGETPHLYGLVSWGKVTPHLDVIRPMYRRFTLPITIKLALSSIISLGG